MSVNKEKIIKEKGDFIISVINEIMNSKDKYSCYFLFQERNGVYKLVIELLSKKNDSEILKEIDLKGLHEYDDELAKYILDYFLNNYIESETIGVSDIERRIFCFQNYYRLKVFNTNGTNMRIEFFNIKNSKKFYDLVDYYNNKIAEFSNSNPTKTV